MVTDTYCEEESGEDLVLWHSQQAIMTGKVKRMKSHSWRTDVQIEQKKETMKSADMSQDLMNTFHKLT